VDAGSGGFACSTDLCVALGELPRGIMHKPNAHMIAQGASVRISGARPTAVSQFQPSTNPAATIVVPPMANPNRLLNQQRIKSRAVCVGRALGLADELTVSNCSMD
jgi:hypothetical protein